MQAIALAEVKRGGWAESIHLGCIAVVNAQGELLHFCGDPHFRTFARSTLKPFQAIPFVHAKGAAHFGFGAPELALMCDSHSGEPMHAEIVQTMLHRAGCSEADLQCGCHVPIAYAAADRQIAPELSRESSYSQLHHNCSGKHAGFLAYCRQHGLDLRSYLEPGHSLQLAVRDSVAHFCGMPPSSLRNGTDGCSAPNYAMPLSRLALAYARLSQVDNDLEYGQAPGILFDAMTAHPELVSGSKRADLAVSLAGRGDWIAKAGAEGVQAIAIRSVGLGIAIKILDGNARALAAVTAAVLRQLGLLSAAARSSLDEYAQPSVLNCKGNVVGSIEPVFLLRHASEKLL